LVGVAGFEPATPSSRTRCTTRLSHTPTFCGSVLWRRHFGACERAAPKLSRRRDAVTMRGGSLERQGRGAVEGDGRRTVDPARRRRRRQTEEVACLLRLRSDRASRGLFWKGGRGHRQLRSRTLRAERPLSSSRHSSSTRVLINSGGRVDTSWPTLRRTRATLSLRGRSRSRQQCDEIAADHTLRRPFRR
jgi:hypothetical protein